MLGDSASDQGLTSQCLFRIPFAFRHSRAGARAPHGHTSVHLFHNPMLFLVTSDLDPQYQKRTIDNVRSALQKIREGTRPGASDFARSSEARNSELGIRNSLQLKILRVSPSFTIFYEARRRISRRNYHGINILRW